MERTVSSVLPAHVGVYIQGCATSTPDGARMPALIGPMVECLADAVERVTVLGLEPPAVPRTQDESADFLARPERDNIEVISLGPVGTWRNYVARRRQVHRVVRARSTAFDVVVIRLPNRRADTFFGANACPRIVSVVLGYAPGVARIVPGGFRRLVQRANTTRTEVTLKSILRASRVVVFNSAEAASHYTNEVRDPVMQPWSMRRSRFSYLAEDRLTDPVTRILICTRLTETKGVFEMLEAFARIRRDVRPGAELHIVGDGDARDALAEEVARRGLSSVVTFHGWVSAGEELFTLMREMDVMLHLSHAEGFPQVIWEALAHSVLVVCTAVGGIPDRLKDRREAMMVEVRNIDQAIRAVAELAEDDALRRTLIREGYDAATPSSTEPIVAEVVSRIDAAWPELRSRFS